MSETQAGAKAKDARETVGMFGFIGLMLTAVGAIVAAAQIPRTADGYGGVEQHGSAVAFFLGVVVSSAGTLMLSFFLVAHAVKCGIRMAREDG